MKTCGICAGSIEEDAFGVWRYASGSEFCLGGRANERHIPLHPTMPQDLTDTEALANWLDD